MMLLMQFRYDFNFFATFFLYTICKFNFMINLREIRNDAKLIDIINYIDVILPK